VFRADRNDGCLLRPCWQCPCQHGSLRPLDDLRPASKTANPRPGSPPPTIRATFFVGHFFFVGRFRSPIFDRASGSPLPDGLRKLWLTWRRPIIATANPNNA
jgi:hypothetical protein